MEIPQGVLISLVGCAMICKALKYVEISAQVRRTHVKDGLPGVRNLSWLPYHVFCKIRNNARNPVCVDLTDYGIKKRFWLSMPTGDSGLSRQIRIFGFREPLNCQCYAEFIGDGDTLLDIGANIGFFALLGGNAKRIVCVEPLNNVIELLQSNIRSNDLSDKCEVVHAAVGPKGKLHLEINPQLNLSRIVSERNQNTIEVESIPLTELADKYHPTVVRLDVEGFEYSLLYGQVPKTIKKISMEFHTGLMGEEKSRELLAYFRDEGFRLRYLVEDVPLRLYPYVHVFKSTGISRFMSYIKEDLDIDEATSLILTGRSLKYLYLERTT